MKSKQVLNQPNGCKRTRKPVRLAAASAAVLMVFAGSPPAGQTEGQPPHAAAKPVRVVGHRGAAGLAPENTLAAFARALDTGVDGIEMDVHLSADGQLVVHHDFRISPDIARGADGSWLKGEGPIIRQLTLAEIKAFDVGRLNPASRYAVRYPEQTPSDGERIPTLSEVLALLQKRGDASTRLWIEIKTSPVAPDVTSAPQAVADALVDALRAGAVAHRSRIMSFDWRALSRTQAIAPEIPTVYLSTTTGRSDTIQAGRPGASPWLAGLDIDDFQGSIPRAVAAAGGRCWAPRYNQLTHRQLAEAQALGLEVYVWTPDRKADLQRLFGMGVEGIITNRPDILRTIVSTPG